VDFRLRIAIIASCGRIALIIGRWFAHHIFNFAFTFRDTKNPQSAIRNPQSQSPDFFDSIPILGVALAFFYGLA
jgi:hypothetical protein